MKHAFAGRPGGTIRISGKSEGKRIRIAYGDDGKGISEDSTPEKSGGFGLQLIARLVDQLSGTFEQGKDGSKGSEFFITFEP